MYELNDLFVDAEPEDEPLRCLRYFKCLNGAVTLGEQRELMKRYLFVKVV